jgi:predicted RNase H-like nuclease (RuvC/YqgF family)
MPNPITPELIAELRRLDSEASPGEWVACGCGKCGLVMGELYVVANTRVEDGPESPSGKQQTADARLIVTARNALPALLDAVEELQLNNQVLLALLPVAPTQEEVDSLEQKLDNVEALVRERDELRARVQELVNGIAQVRLTLAERVQLYRESAACESIHGECQDLAIAGELEMVVQALDHRFGTGGKGND